MRTHGLQLIALKFQCADVILGVTNPSEHSARWHRSNDLLRSARHRHPHRHRRIHPVRDLVRRLAIVTRINIVESILKIASKVVGIIIVLEHLLFRLRVAVKFLHSIFGVLPSRM